MDLDKIYGSDKRNLLITTVGSRSFNVCRMWAGGKRNYDIILIYYDDDSCSDFKDLSDFLIAKKGFKYPLLYEFFRRHPFIIQKYDFFFLPDDDIVISSSGINLLFECAEKFMFAVCQPSLQPINYTYDITVNFPYTAYRYVSMVEIMCPLFSKKSLNTCLNSFNESQSGWGLELAWSSLLTISPSKIAVIDDVKATHSEPINLENGHLYKNLKKKGVVPQEDFFRICRKYQSDIYMVNLGYSYRHKVHQRIYEYIQSIEKEHLFDYCKFMSMLILNYRLIRVVVDTVPSFSRIIIDSYKGLDCNERINDFSLFYNANENDISFAFCCVFGNHVNWSLVEFLEVNEWDSICNQLLVDIQQGHQLGSLIFELNIIIGTHFNCLTYSKDLLFYVLHTSLISFMKISG